MTVRKLISELKKMPQNLEVNIAAHDHSEWETAGDTFSVIHCIKKDLREDYSLDTNLSIQDLDCFESKPKQWVVIRG